MTADLFGHHQPCCPKENVANLAFHDTAVNKVCLSCGEHWYGTPADTVRYQRKQWDALMEAAA